MHSVTTPNRQQGHVLLILMGGAVVCGCFFLFELQQKQTARAQPNNDEHAERALYRALGELAIAEAMVRSSAYDEHGHNVVIGHALETPGQRIPHTGVHVQPLAEGSDWFLLTARARSQSGERVVKQVMRQGDFFGGFPLFRSEHPEGISRTPLHAVATNKELQRYFPESLSVHRVDSPLGLPTTALTRDRADLAQLEKSAENRFRFPDEHEVEVLLRVESGAQIIDLRLFTSPWDEIVTKNGTRKVSEGGHWETKTATEAVYVDDVRTVEKPVYQWRDGDKSIASYVPVEETFQRFSHEHEVEKRVWVKDQVTESYDYTETIHHERELVAEFTSAPPDNGLIYAAGPITALRGDVIGRLTIASANSITITGNVRYRDADGNGACVVIPGAEQPFKRNPHYEGNAVLGLVANGDLYYGLEAPADLEIHASLVSLSGRVGIPGLELDDDGAIARWNRLEDEFKKQVVRRFGEVESALAPVDAIVKGEQLASGFADGQALFDAMLLTTPPPYFRERPVACFFDARISQ